MRDDNLRFTWEEDDEEGPGMYRVMDHAGHYDDVLSLSEAQARIIAFAFNASADGYMLAALSSKGPMAEAYDGPVLS